MSMVDSQAPAPDMTMTARLTESGLDVFYGSTAEGAVVHMARDAEELRTERTPRTDTPLEAFAGTWTMETMFLGTMQLTYTPEMGERQVFCTIDGLTMFPGAGLESFPEGTSFPLTFEDGVLRTTIPLTVQMAASSALVKEIVVDYDLTFFHGGRQPVRDAAIERCAGQPDDDVPAGSDGKGVTNDEAADKHSAGAADAGWHGAGGRDAG